MLKCPVCSKEVENRRKLRKHAIGKWGIDTQEVEHLKLAIELSLGVSAYLKDSLDGSKLNIEEVTDVIADVKDEVPKMRGVVSDRVRGERVTRDEKTI